MLVLGNNVRMFIVGAQLWPYSGVQSVEERREKGGKEGCEGED